MRRSRDAAVGALVAATVALAACDTEPARPDAKPLATRPVRVEHARLDGAGAGEEVVGTVRARNSAQISSTVVGKVQSLTVILGRRVRAGDLCDRLRPRLLERVVASFRRQ